MVQGTSSYCGKTFVVAALCRIFANMGIKVAPFKAQNMSLNSYVTSEGCEIARAQALQALACGIEPTVDMNPVLLKPKGHGESQVVIHGRPYRDVGFKEYMDGSVREACLKAIKESLNRLLSRYELVVIEGAGSPAEINLYEKDIANMRIAGIADAPVILVGDIDRGGVFASIYGTVNLLKDDDRERVKGFIINKFRGDYRVLEPGLRRLEELTGKKVLGVVPYVEGLSLPSEDSLSLEERKINGKGLVNIAVIRLPRISNYTDFEPFDVYRSVSIKYVSKPGELIDPDVIIIPGTKNTLLDLDWLRDNGLEERIASLYDKGIPIIGICGGFQILGEEIDDMSGIEGGMPRRVRGMGLLGVKTEFNEYSKITKRVTALVEGRGFLLDYAKGSTIRGYEIHMGRTSLTRPCMNLFRIIRSCDTHEDRLEGAVSDDGLVFGTYVHGLFDSPALRMSVVRSILRKKGIGIVSLDSASIEEEWDRSLERIAEVLRGSVDVDQIMRMCKLLLAT